MHLLVVEDDATVRETLCRLLEAAGWKHTAAEHAGRARELLARSSRDYDLILLDVRMPGQSGLDFLRELRRGGDDTPVIFLTGVDPVGERVKGLQLGADDYILKPFKGEELVARIEAVMRRRLALPVIRVGDLAIDIAHRTVRRNGSPIDLSPLDFDFLLALVRADGGVCSRADLLREVWGLSFDPGTTLVEVQVVRLRRKLELHGPRLIENVKGKGYRLATLREPGSEQEQGPAALAGEE